MSEFEAVMYVAGAFALIFLFDYLVYRPWLKRKDDDE